MLPTPAPTKNITAEALHPTFSSLNVNVVFEEGLKKFKHYLLGKFTSMPAATWTKSFSGNALK